MRKLLECCKLPRWVINKLAPASYEDLKEAVVKNDVAGVRELLGSGAPVTSNNETILYVAVAEGSLQMIELVATRLPELINERNEMGDTAYMQAIFLRRREAIDFLADLSDLSLGDGMGHTACMAAAANADLDTLNQLRKSGPRLLLRKSEEGQTALHKACFYGHLKVVHFLLEHSTLKVSETDQAGNNCLHLACVNLHFGVTRYLIDRVVEAQTLLLVPNKAGNTPYMLAQQTLHQLKFKAVMEINMLHLIGPNDEQIQQKSNQQSF